MEGHRDCLVCSPKDGIHPIGEARICSGFKGCIRNAEVDCLLGLNAEEPPHDLKTVPVHCSFCGRSHEQAKAMFSGGGSTICDACVLAAARLSLNEIKEEGMDEAPVFQLPEDPDERAQFDRSAALNGSPLKAVAAALDAYRDRRPVLQPERAAFCWW
jgi:hypothetical protein